MNELKIKLCGNHSLEDLQYTINSKANYIGIVFAPSKRKVNAKEVKSWLESVQLGNDQKLVGIFVNATNEEISEVMKDVPLHIIQAHGNETVGQLLYMKEQFYQQEIWKAIHHGPDALEKMRTFEGVVDGYVIDAKVQGQWGGSGERFDWSHIPQYIEEARRQNVLCLFAGGITPENVTDIIRNEIDGIDISSGIETNGTKDAIKIKQLEERLIRNE
jgi:phosphoribosylanthranilate isomerase